RLAVVQRLSPTRLGGLLDHQVTLRTRQGPILQARLRDLDAPAEVFGRSEYDFSVIDWSSLRTAIDVGAHIGSFTLWLAGRSGCDVYAIEPNPATFRILIANLRLAGLDRRVRTDQIAVAGISGGRR